MSIHIVITGNDGWLVQHPSGDEYVVCTQIGLPGETVRTVASEKAGKQLRERNIRSRVPCRCQERNKHIHLVMCAV